MCKNKFYMLDRYNTIVDAINRMLEYAECEEDKKAILSYCLKNISENLKNKGEK